MRPFRPLLALPAFASLWLLSCCSARIADDGYRLGGSQAFYAEGKVAALGSRSRFESDEFIEAERLGKPLPRWREFLRVGRWEYRYPNGQTKANVSYEVAWYTECCTGGFCEQPYELRVGEFQAWWPNGAPLARGSFQSNWRHIETNCEGGDKVKVAVIGPDAQFWDQDGAPADRSILEVAGVDLEGL